jgi:predicted nucleic acid-binding protein
VLELAAEGTIELIVPDLVAIELGRVLGEKLGIGADSLRALLELLADVATTVTTPASADPRSGDNSDDRILEAALAAGADVLVSGDRRHLLPLGTVAGMRIVRPRDLLAELAS